MGHDTGGHTQGVLRDLADSKRLLEMNSIVMEEQIRVHNEQDRQARLYTSRLPAW